MQVFICLRPPPLLGFVWGGVENTNMTDCISSLQTLLNTSKDKHLGFGVFIVIWSMTLRVFYLELLAVVGLADGGGVPAKPLKKLLPGTLGMVHDSKVRLPGTTCGGGASGWRGCTGKTAEKVAARHFGHGP